jgi:phosphohistidine swiveling domain-containing protein
MSSLIRKLDSVLARQKKLPCGSSRCFPVAGEGEGGLVKATIERGDGISEVAKRFNDAQWVKQGTWPGAFLWFFAILESFASEWTGHVLDARLAIDDYAAIGQPHGAFDCLIGSRCFDQVRATMEEAWRAQGTKYFDDYARLCEETFEEWLAFSRQVSGRDLSHATNSELAGVLHDYFVHMRKNGAFMDTIIVLADLLGDIVGHDVEEFLRAKGIEDPAAYGAFLDAHLPPPSPTNIVLSQASLRDIAKAISESDRMRRLFEHETPNNIAAVLQRDEPPLQERITEHQRRFGWLNTYSFSGQPFTNAEVIALVQEALDEGDRADTLTSAASRGLRRMTDLRIPTALKELLQATSRLTYVNTAKDDAHQITWQEIQPLITTAATRLGCTTSEITLASPEELVEALCASGPLHPESIERRREGWALLKRGNSLSVVQGASDVDRLRSEIKPTIPLDLKEIKGRPIVAGRVKGRARLVLTSNDCAAVEMGDILVATNTNPDFISAMRRAAAFVTDTGNLICHAVIAAREFQKPCVIATQIATQVIKNGDWLEVDGGSGVITRLGVEVVK